MTSPLCKHGHWHANSPAVYIAVYYGPVVGTRIVGLN